MELDVNIYFQYTQKSQDKLMCELGESEKEVDCLINCPFSKDIGRYFFF